MNRARSRPRLAVSLAPGFHLRSVLKQAVEQGIRIVSNAGGVNPKGCAAAAQALADELGVKVRIAIVEGDDVLPLAGAMRDAGTVTKPPGTGGLVTPATGGPPGRRIIAMLGI